MAEQVTQKERVYIVPTGPTSYGFNLTYETEFFSCSETYSHQLDGYSGWNLKFFSEILESSQQTVFKDIKVLQTVFLLELWDPVSEAKCL